MITVISGTNRKHSKTRVVANTYFEMFQKKYDGLVHLVALEDLSDNWFHDNMYTAEGQSDEISKVQNEKFLPAKKYFIVSPEYNGGMPGVLKLFLDALAAREGKGTFGDKKAGLTGVSSGRAGNLRGMDQLNEILNHLGTCVMPNKLPLSNIDSLTNENSVTDEATMEVIENQVKDFINF